MSWDVMLSASVMGAIFTFLSNIIIAWYRSRQQRKSVDMLMLKKFGIEGQQTLTAQFEALMRASESYREEVRHDMQTMRNEYDALHTRYQAEISDMKEFYEGEIATLRQKIANLTEEVVSYRRENGALHLLLQQQGVEIPSWVVRNKENGK